MATRKISSVMRAVSTASLLAGTVLLLAGCGGSGQTGAQKAPKVIHSPSSPPPRANSAPPADQVANNQPQALPSSRTNAAKSSPGKPKDKADPFADVDPRHRFAVTGTGPEVTIGSAADVAGGDQFLVEPQATDGDSSQFVIGDAGGGQRGTAANATSTSASQISLPSGFTPVTTYGFSDQGLPLRIRGEKTGALMALVPAGPARIGSAEGPEHTQPEFTTFLDAYYLDINEVTLGQYAKFRDDIKQRKNSKVQLPVNDGADDDLPALGLPWAIAQAFAHWQGKELPTEAEFEHAARGADGWRYPWGNGRPIWPRARSQDEIIAVQSYPTDQSVYGIFDLAGNAREWCQDIYADDAHQEALTAPAKLQQNWSGPKKGGSAGLKVVKGNGPDWSAWHRESRPMNSRHADVGFRCVLRLKGTSAGSAREN